MAIRSNNASMELPRRETCVKCKLPVFLVERVLLGKQLYHSGCFRCARCNQPMTAGNFYEMEGGGYCCEMCPNEEEQVVPGGAPTTLSDEEKSTTFFSACEALPRSIPISEFTLARTDFMKDLLMVTADGDTPTSEPFSQEDDDDSCCLPTTNSFKLSVNINTSVRDKDPNTDNSTKEMHNEHGHFANDTTEDDPVMLMQDADMNSSIIVISDDSKLSTSFTDDSNLTASSKLSDQSNVNADVLQSDPYNDQRENNKLNETENSWPQMEIMQASGDIDKSTETLDQIAYLSSLEPKKPEVGPRLKKVVPRDSLYKVSTGSTGETPEDYKTIKYKRESILPMPHDSMNPFSDDEDDAQTETSTTGIKQYSSNPFGNDDDEPDCEHMQNAKQTSQIEYSDGSSFERDGSDNLKNGVTATTRKGATIFPRPTDSKMTTGGLDDTQSVSSVSQSPPTTRKSYNPFSSDEDDNEVTNEAIIQLNDKPLKKLTLNAADTVVDKTTLKYKRESILPMYQASRTSLNPFSSDEDDDALAPSTQRSLSSVIQNRSSSHGSITSLASTASSSVNSTHRKKKPAPKPPIPTIGQTNSTNSSPQASITSSPSTSAQHSPRPRKSKRAPLPPSITATSTPVPTVDPISVNAFLRTPPSKISASGVNTIDYEKEKVAKDEANRQTQSSSLYVPPRDKSTYGRWKRKKHQAPSLPVPQKRTIKALPMTELKKELDIIEVQLQGLNKQGVRLEKIIRDQCEGPDADPTATEVPIEVEDLILQLFEVVNEKNELCRRQAELMYLRRQHRLEEEQADIEYQVRCLMLQSCKTDSEKARETELIARLVEIVDMRAEIVECLEMDRVRGVEEDDSILCSMNMYANKRDEAAAMASLPSSESKPKKEKKKKFRKLLKFKKFTGHKMDADKDVDESETHISSSSKSNRSKKK